MFVLNTIHVILTRGEVIKMYIWFLSVKVGLQS